MGKYKLKDTKKLTTVIKKYDSELEVLKTARFQIEKYYEEARDRYSDALNIVNTLEDELRRGALQDQYLSLTNMSVRRDYLLQQRELVEQHRLEKDRIAQQRDGIIEKLQQQKVKIQLLEKLRSRRLASIYDDLEKQAGKELDELWLTRQQS